MSNLGNVTIEIEASSYWLKLNQFKLASSAIKKANELLVNEANLLKTHWLSTEKSVENTRAQSESITRNLCDSPPCRLCNMNDAYKKEWATFMTSSSGGLLGLFGGTKTETVKIRVNYFKCDIFRKTTKKCIWVLGKCSCSTVRVEEYFDKACMLRVDAALKEASRLEELAYWKEEVNDLNKERNLGFQYVLEELARRVDNNPKNISLVSFLIRPKVL